MYNVDLSFIERSNLEWLRANTIYLCVHGSHAYGSNTPESDLDLRGIAIPSKEYLLGCTKKFEQADSFSNEDAVIFSLQKFMNLATVCNPNVLELLFVDPDEYIITTDLSHKLIDNRDVFLSKKAKYTHSGYAIAQMKRIRGHHKYLTNPPTHAPTRAEFNLPEHTLMPKDQLLAVEALIKKKLDTWNVGFENVNPDDIIRIQGEVTEILTEIAGASLYLEKEKLWKQASVSLGMDSNFVELIAKEKLYKARKTEWHQYQDWKKNRNPARAKLEAQYKYDTKHASHLYRLFSQCEEILLTGTLTLKKPERVEIMRNIRNGGWSYEKLVEFSDREDKRMDLLYEKSNLRHSPNITFINNLCIELIEGFLRKQ